MLTQNPHFTQNRGFRAKDNTVFTYEQTKKGFSYSYVKREVQSDGIHTKPLSVVLNPLRNDHIVYVDANSILSNYHQYGILNNYSVTNDDEYYFFSAHQLSMYAMAHFHSLDDVANEIKQYTNHFELYHKKMRFHRILSGMTVEKIK